jgi:hypothetical protein
VKFEEREKINRSSDDVYLTLSRPDLYLSSWSRGVLSAVQVKDQAAGERLKYKVTGRDLGGKAHWHYEVTSCVDGTSFAAKATGGPVPFNDHFTLRSLEDGTTEVIHTQEIYPKGMFTLLGPVLPLVWPTLIRHNLSKLKSVMEARKSTSPGASKRS